MFKIVTAEEAVKQIRSNDTIAVNTFGGTLYPDFIVAALERRFLEQHDIEGLNFYATASTGSAGLHKFSDRLCHEGLIKEAVVSFYENLKELGPLAQAEKVAAYNFPQGILCQLLQAAAGGRPAVVSEVGLGTFIDPRFGGGKLNKSAARDLVSVIEIDGREYLLYKTPKLDVCLLRGTTVDPVGNITFEKEALYVDALNMAMAAKANGGTVIVQVERSSGQRAHPKDVVIPGILVDYVVVDSNQFQTKATQFSPYYSGELFMPEAEAATYNDDFLARNAQCLTRKHNKEHHWAARRAALELRRGALINLGTGLPTIISTIAKHEGVTDDMVFTVESGVVGGVPVVAPDFGVAINAQVIYGMDSQFNLYDGRGLDLCFVGAAQVDREGNINVSKVGAKYIGVGGFVNITSSAKKVIFCTTFTAGKGLETSFDNGRLRILKDGPIPKFVGEVEQISFSGRVARKKRQTVLVVTERCVFQLGENGLVLTEIAPGVDLQKDILDCMGFAPEIAADLKTMDPRIFTGESLDLRDTI